jgi:hypothetical protein
MGTTFTKTNTFNCKHTYGDTFDKTCTVTTPSTWSGYTSGKCYIRNQSGDIVLELILSIATNGQLRIYKTGVINIPIGIYYWDLQWTMSDGKIKTWVAEDNSPYIFEVTKQ